MKLGRIVGTVVSTRKDPKIEGLRLYLVQDLTLALEGRESFVVAADAMGAGVGEVVLYASGSSARQTDATNGRPVDAVVMAIVDTIDREGDLVFNKNPPFPPEAD
ncbi:MAG: EutN/CcmL family microcompartment protein [Proteobacteria bacterium]|nr:EutN/CcmL family microcompartment protein [Pseudomonadota bacterium]MCP4917871.1 EutN/CcmL family microcompartment protein [Pseudomonadota bacterium]